MRNTTRQKRKRDELFHTYHEVCSLETFLKAQSIPIKASKRQETPTNSNGLVSEEHESENMSVANLLTDTDSDEYRVLLRDAVLAVPHGVPAVQSVVKGFSQADVVHRLISTLFQDSALVRFPSDHVLTCGYRAARSQSNHGVRNIQGVESKHINTIVTYLKSKVWEVLLSRIGDDLMTYILRYTAIFKNLPNACYLQVSGPASHLQVPIQRQLLKRYKQRHTQQSSERATTTTTDMQQNKDTQSQQSRPTRAHSSDEPTLFRKAHAEKSVEGAIGRDMQRAEAGRARSRDVHAHTHTTQVCSITAHAKDDASAKHKQVNPGTRHEQSRTTGEYGPDSTCITHVNSNRAESTRITHTHSNRAEGLSGTTAVEGCSKPVRGRRRTAGWLRKKLNKQRVRDGYTVHTPSHDTHTYTDNLVHLHTGVHVSDVSDECQLQPPPLPQMLPPPVEYNHTPHAHSRGGAEGRSPSDLNNCIDCSSSAGNTVNMDVHKGQDNSPALINHADPFNGTNHTRHASPSTSTNAKCTETKPGNTDTHNESDTTMSLDSVVAAGDPFDGPPTPCINPETDSEHEHEHEHKNEHEHEHEHEGYAQDSRATTRPTDVTQATPHTHTHTPPAAVGTGVLLHTTRMPNKRSVSFSSVSRVGETGPGTSEGIRCHGNGKPQLFSPIARTQPSGKRTWTGANPTSTPASGSERRLSSHASLKGSMVCADFVCSGDFD